MCHEINKTADLEDTLGIRDALKIISSFEIKSDDDFIDVLKLISRVTDEIGPSATFVLQVEAALRLYNYTKDPSDPLKSFADAILVMQERKLRDFKD